MRSIHNYELYVVQCLRSCIAFNFESCILSGNEDTLIYPEEDNFSLRDGYDHVIRCLGFKFDFSLFHK